MRVALIPPLHRLDDLKLTNYQLMLPYIDGLPTRRNPRYCDYYAAAVKRGDYVILDNGAAEGKMDDWQSLLNLAKYVGATEVILPDVIGDQAGTFRVASAAWHTRDSMLKYMYVAQGQTMGDVMLSIDEARQLSPYLAIGLPRHLLTTISFDARVQLVRWMNEAFSDRLNIHLLGTNRSWLQEVKYIQRVDRKKYIRGVDTSAPYCYAAFDADMTEDEIDRPDDYFHGEPDSDHWNRRADGQIRLFLEWADAPKLI